MKVNLKKVLGILTLIGVLALAFWYGGSAPGLQGWEFKPDQDLLLSSSQEEKEEEKLEELDKPKENERDLDLETSKEDQQEKKDEENKAGAGLDKKKSRPGANEQALSAREKIKLAEDLAGGSSKGVKKGSKAYSQSQGMELDTRTGKDKYQTDPVPQGMPLPMEPETTVISDKIGRVTLSVRCDSILENLDWLNPDKLELVPEDGVIYASKEVEFYQGESVFNLLLREMKKSKIHLEFSDTPMYNSAYIEGINNIYEFDCGELSGWMFKVNGWFPNYGASRYALKEGDLVEWVYTCDLGNDVGGLAAIGGD